MLLPDVSILVPKKVNQNAVYHSQASGAIFSLVVGTFPFVGDFSSFIGRFV